MDFGDLTLVLNAASFAALVAGAAIYYKSSLSANTIKLYKENQEALTGRLNILTTDLADARTEQTAMKEELRVIKTLPLNTILATLTSMMESQNTILSTQNKILHQLETSPGVNITNNPAK